MNPIVEFVIALMATIVLAYSTARAMSARWETEKPVRFTALGLLLGGSTYMLMISIVNLFV